MKRTHTGWSAEEDNLLLNAVEQARRAHTPLQAAFESVADATARRPNSVRNRYYSELRVRENAEPLFTPFTDSESDALIRAVLLARAEGQSVRACTMALAGGDTRRMLRYQNKYRAVIKSRPDYVQDIVEKLKSQGVACETPQVNHRARADLQQSGEALVSEARRSGDRELARACDVLTQYLRAQRGIGQEAGLADAARDVIGPIKEFVALDASARMEAAESFCDDIAARIGALEARLEDE